MMPSPEDRLLDLAARQREALRPVGRSMSVHEVLVEEEENGHLIGVLTWNRDYDVRADARKAAWQADFFTPAVQYLFTPAHLR